MTNKYNSRTKRFLNGFVFRNLHQPGVVWSVRDTSGHTVLHSGNILVRNAKFIVQKGGQARVRKFKQKEVHAGVKGEIIVDAAAICQIYSTMIMGDSFQAFYNPYVNDTFVDAANNVMETAAWVLLTERNSRSCVLFLTE